MKIAAFINTPMKLTVLCTLSTDAPASESRGTPMHRPCARKPYDSKGSELLLGTDAVDVVVNATAARAGQIAAPIENSVAEPAPPTAETSAGSYFF